MDQTLVYAKTPIGDEAVRQSTRVVQRNLRMMLVQVDGKLSVAELSAKLGDARMVERSLQKLEEGGYIAPMLEAVSAWRETRLKQDRLPADDASRIPGVQPGTAEESIPHSISSNFSSFGKPILPAREVSVPLESSASEAPESRPRRSYGALVRWGLALLLVLAVAAVLLFPYARFKPGIEAELARLWRTPVSVGDVQLNLWPKPALLLSEVSIGKDGESRIARIRILEPQALLASGEYKLPRVEIAGAQLAVAHILALTEGRDDARPLPGVSLSKIGIEGLAIVAGSLVSSEFFGECGFSSDGRLEEAALQNADGSLRGTMQTMPTGMALALEGSAWRPSADSALTLDALKATGALQKDKLLIESFDANALGGVLKGSWLIDWGKGLAMAGDAALTRLEARKVAVHFAPTLGVDGELSGNLRLRGVGANWQAMWANLEAVLDGRVMRGVLRGVDLGEAARRGPGAPVRAGTTRFDRLTFRMTIDPQQVVGRDLSLIDGPFSVTGQFVATRGRPVDATLAASVSGSTVARTVPIRVSGTLPSLQAVAIR